MSLLHRNLPTSQKVLVCLPGPMLSPADARLRVLAAVAPYAEGARLGRQLLDAITADGYDPFTETADGSGPLDLLGHTTAGSAAVDLAIEQHQHWTTAVTGTPKARDLRSFLSGWDDDADIPDVIRRFTHQQRIRAMRSAERVTPARFPLGDYGPGLTAHQAGLSDYVPYFIDTVLFGDGLITGDGVLIAPTGTGDDPDLPILPRLWHTFDERLDYHQKARKALRSAERGTVVVSVEATLRPRPVATVEWRLDHATAGPLQLIAVRVPEATDPTDLIVCPALVAEAIGRPQLAGKIIGRVVLRGPHLDTSALHDPDDMRVGQRAALGSYNNPFAAIDALLGYYLAGRR